MAYLNDRVLDNGLTILDTEVTHLYICSQEPTSYTEATSTYDLGVKAAPSVGAPTDRTPNGRKVVVSAILDGTVTDTGTATHYALVDANNSRLLATNTVTSQVVTSGNTFTLAALDIGIPDGVSA